MQTEQALPVAVIGAGPSGRDLRLHLDRVIEGVRVLGPPIGPGTHACGSLPPHGHPEVGHHPEPGFCMLGVKNYASGIADAVAGHAGCGCRVAA